MATSSSSLSAVPPMGVLKAQQAEQPVSHPLPAPPPPSKLAEEDDADLNALSSMMTSFNWSNDAVETCAKAIMDPEGTPEDKVKGVHQLKQLLCTSREHVFRVAQDVIDSGVLKGLVRLVASEESHFDLRLPAAFCLTNIAAGNDEQTAAVVEAGAVSVLLELLVQRDEQLRRQAIFCLANIAGSTPEFRRRLASHPKYFSSIIYAVVRASDLKMEELAGWNIRNMIVLGGPDFYQLREGLEFFSDQVHKHSPLPAESHAMIITGAATLNAVATGNTSWPRSTSYQSHSPFEVQFQETARVGANVLRFACESFSWISREEEGRHAIIAWELPLPLLFQAKFNSNPSVRNHALECLANLAQFGSRHVRLALLKLRAPIALSELLADHISYSPHQRVMAARSIYWLASDCSVREANMMCEQTVTTREVARKMLTARATELRKREARHAHEDSYENDTGSDMDAVDLAGEDDTSCAVEDIRGGLHDHGAPDLDELSSIPGASTLEIAYTIFNQVERPEEFTLREKCGRILLAILVNVAEPTLLNAISADLFRLLLNILDMACDVDLQQMQSAEGTSGASAIEALRPGEPSLPTATFVSAVLKLLERLFDLGVELRRRQGFLENPITVMFNQEDGSQRLESAISRGGFPFELVQRTILLMQTYCT